MTQKLTEDPEADPNAHGQEKRHPETRKNRTETQKSAKECNRSAETLPD